ncbi:WD40/YVTN/BNR-like repeat-containing protein [Pseudomonas abietaniphila]|uniref:WD40/YVTN/BNR-like repeat-containing protein n=1 Tax=Pseudomonas abietaniphila TaxID=89065 RepID=UPI000783424D|nr:hypothetical protein [Pseudomonas abietaniphila]
MAATTPIPLLPDAPSRSDGQAEFTAKADPFIAALPPMVVNINSRLTWIWEQVTAVDGYRQAAAQSAADAQGFAGSANTSKNAAAQSATDATNNGKAQVDLAKAQVTLAQQAATAAQSAAQAAGAAAGLPGGRVPYTVLQINAAGNVSWGDGLIDKTSAVPGQALMLGTGKAPKWDFPGQQIGDVLQTSRDPGALYLPANGSIRLQSAYPALFAKLGLIGGAIGTAWADYDYGGIATNVIAASLGGTVIAWQSQTQVRRSIDRGQTWTNITTPSLGANALDIKTDGAGTWIISSAATVSPFQFLRSTDDGQTWQLVTVPATSSGAGGSWTKLLYCGGGVWLATCSYGLTMLRSTNGGSGWNTVTHGYSVSNPPIAFEANGAGTVLIIGYDGTSYTVRKSTDYGASFTNFMTLSGQGPIIRTDGQGTWIIGLNGVNALRSFDDAATPAGFAPITITGGVGNSADILFVSGLTLFMFGGSGTRVIVQNANGSFSPQSTASNVTVKFAYAGNGTIFAGSATANRLSRSLAQFGYDTSTQFAIPNVQTAVGISAYIKAKELA